MFSLPDFDFGFEFTTGPFLDGLISTIASLLSLAGTIVAAVFVVVVLYVVCSFALDGFGWAGLGFDVFLVWTTLLALIYITDYIDHTNPGTAETLGGMTGFVLLGAVVLAVWEVFDPMRKSGARGRGRGR